MQVLGDAVHLIGGDGGMPWRARVTDLRVELTPPDGLPARRRDALLAVASHCAVHNTPDRPPPVAVSLAGDGGAQPTGR